MVHTVELPQKMVTSKTKSSNCSKLASTVIWGASDTPLDADAIKKTIESSIGIFYSVVVQPEAKNHVKIKISASDERLENCGLMQMSVFQVLSTLCQKNGVRALRIENEFLPDYA